MNKKWNRRELKANAKARMKLNYWKSVLVGLLATLVTVGFAGVSTATTAGESAKATYPEGADTLGEAIATLPLSMALAVGIVTIIVVVTILILALLIRALLINPLEVGCRRFFYRNLLEKADVKEVCFAYDKGYKTAVDALFFRDIYTMLWTLLFIIPGIVKSYEYRMMPYILAENPGMDKKECFALSRQMMMGNKWKAFIMDLSFIPWEILAILTLGMVNFFYLAPYKNMTDAGLYQALKEI